MTTLYDTIIVGGGPAGLSAALILGRCRRRVLVCDLGKPRNAASVGLHGFLSRDGILPADLRAAGHEELTRYGVDIRRVEVLSGCPVDEGFEVRLADGACLRSRTLLIATGVVDHLPRVEGLPSMYGRSVFHCPYCDGWEHRDEPLAVYGRGRAGVELGLKLKLWTPDVVLCSDGPSRIGRLARERLARHDVPVRTSRIVRLEGSDGQLERIVFAKGDPLPRRALFFTTGQFQRSELPATLGCVFDKRGTVRTDHLARTGVPGLYVAGDASHDVQFAIVAAAEGAKAAVSINTLLQESETM